ncbi:hypothetical protein [Plantactinospora sp. CA-290183]|uniref:hypothetical protein n=1 Tax=Plantactinospora sp. CA-290183 TaxID=3240006 RepID=UPI003D90C9D6
MTNPGPPGFPASYPGPVPPGAPVPPPGAGTVPPGPGAVPPFAAPPTEGRTVRMWLGLGVAALALLLCCGGGGAALVGLFVSGTEAVNEQAQAVVGDYFDALRREDFGEAYDQLCADAKRRESPREFEERVASEPEIASFQVGDVSVTTELAVPVDVTYTGGGQDNLRAVLDQDGSTGAFKVCAVS